MASIVYMVRHLHVLPGGWRDTKGIGIYATREKAQAACERAKLWPGFRDSPDGFEIVARLVDADGWLNGEMDAWYG